MALSWWRMRSSSSRRMASQAIVLVELAKQRGQAAGHVVQPVLEGLLPGGQAGGVLGGAGVVDLLLQRHHLDQEAVRHGLVLGVLLPPSSSIRYSARSTGSLSVR